MAKYFNFFPRTTYYKNKDSTSVDIITNITTRYNFNDGLNPPKSSITDFLNINYDF